MKKTSLLYFRFKIFFSLKRARYSLFIFTAIFIISMFASFIANEKPIFVYKDHRFYFPIFVDYSERDFGGEFYTSADYTSKYMLDLLKDCIHIYPIISYSQNSIDWTLKDTPPTSISKEHLLGTDDMGRDVLARLLYGMRDTLLFGIILSFFSLVIGIMLGAFQGYYGGLVDLLGQRAIEIWNSIPALFIIIILSSFITPGFWIILFIALLFSWSALASVVRTEFLRARVNDYVLASRALGSSNMRIIFIHIMPNALVATITYMPFIVAGSITTLVSLDFLGFGLPLGSASLGELLNQGKNNINAIHLGLTGFISISVILSTLVFIGDGVREAFSFKNIK